MQVQSPHAGTRRIPHVSVVRAIDKGLIVLLGEGQAASGAMTRTVGLFQVSARHFTCSDVIYPG